MGRSTASCFKIIACGGGGGGGGGDSEADKDDSEAPQIKGDKKGWSFRKRSARHRVLSNTVISETAPSPALVIKEATESAADVNFETPVDAKVPEKFWIPQCADEKPQRPAFVDLKLSGADPVVETNTEGSVDFELEESAAISIQCAVRSFMAQRELLKLKNVIKLQAAVRGHLERRHAVGSLRCVQAIVKMQARVRARRARALGEGHLENSVADGKPNEDTSASQTLDKATSQNKPCYTYVSIEKLLSNRFARQLLDSTPKDKPINIKCDVSKSDSAWQWLARWATASSPEPSPNVNVSPKPSGTEECLTSKTEAEDRPEVCSNLTDSVFSRNEKGETLESEENLIMYEKDKIKYEECKFASHVVQEITGPSAVEETIEPDHPRLDEVGASMEKETHSIESCGAVNFTSHSHSDELPMGSRRSVSGSKKTTNPSFIAAQSKFESLSSIANSSGSIYTDAESKLEDCQEDSVNEMKVHSLAENSTNQMRAQAGGSECGTELSVSSTLDSPDRYDAGKMELVNNMKVHEEESCSFNGIKVQKSAAESPAISHPALSKSTSDHPEKNASDVTAEPANSFMTTNGSPEAYSESAQQTHNGSPEASPRSHMTVPGSQGTPASQGSVNTKGSKVEKTGSNSIHKLKSLNKKLQSSPHNDSGASSTNKHNGRDQKSSKKGASFGSANMEILDQEPRDSSSSSSLPRFMLATESAKAKVNANNSPRSSPDVSDREAFIKKRHSLPISNGRHGSPRIQRTMSQTEQNGKANGAPAQERKWMR